MMSDQIDDSEERAIAGTHSYVPPQSDAQKHNLYPVTIFQMLQAEASPFFEDKSLVIDERHFSAVSNCLLSIGTYPLNYIPQVTLVAHVTRVEMQPAKAIYILEDGTGRICAEKDLNSLYFFHGLSAEAEKEEITQSEAL